MVVVGRLPGTGVAAARNVRTAAMNKPTAKRTHPRRSAHRPAAALAAAAKRSEAVDQEESTPGRPAEDAQARGLRHPGRVNPFLDILCGTALAAHLGDSRSVGKAGQIVAPQFPRT